MLLRHLSQAMVLIALSTAGTGVQGDFTISPRGLDGVGLCQPLSVVGRRFPLARDTVMESEGVSWPAKTLPLGAGQGILFEASWMDTTHIWGISTNGRRYRTAHGYRVGMALGDLRAKGAKLRFDYGEGRIVVTLVEDTVSFLPDDATAGAFLRRSPMAFDSLEALPSTARIQDLFVSGDCRR